jgi:hypothetical protein
MKWGALAFAPFCACALVACELEVTTIGALGDASFEKDGVVFSDSGAPFLDTGRFVDVGGFSDGTVTDVGWSDVSPPSDTLHFRGLWLADADEPWLLAVDASAVDASAVDASADADEDADSTSDAGDATGGTLLRLVGTSWKSLDVPPGNALWGASPAQVWLVGPNSLGWTDGTSYYPVTLHGPVDLTTVWGSDASHVWAAGTTMLVTADGASWTGDLSFAPGPEVHALGGTNEKDVWAVGDGGSIRHWDGTMWSPYDSGVSIPLRAVWAADAHNAWIVGDGGKILRLTGSIWTDFPSGTPASLLGVSGSSNADVWIAGQGGTLIHWDGSTRSLIPDSKSVDLTAIASGNYGEAWAIGDTVILRFLRSAP